MTQAQILVRVIKNIPCPERIEKIEFLEKQNMVAIVWCGIRFTIVSSEQALAVIQETNTNAGCSLASALADLFSMATETEKHRMLTFGL